MIGVVGVVGVEEEGIMMMMMMMMMMTTTTTTTTKWIGHELIGNELWKPIRKQKPIKSVRN